MILIEALAYHFGECGKLTQHLHAHLTCSLDWICHFTAMLFTITRKNTKYVSYTCVEISIPKSLYGAQNSQLDILYNWKQKTNHEVK